MKTLAEILTISQVWNVIYQEMFCYATVDDQGCHLGP